MHFPMFPYSVVENAVTEAQLFAFDDLPQVPDSQLRFIHRALTAEKLVSD